MTRWVAIPMIAALAAASACGDSDSSPDVSDGMPRIIEPSGYAYELYASRGHLSLRPGQTRDVAMTVVNVGSSGGTWTVDSIDWHLVGGVTVTSEPPPTLDVPAGDQVTFNVGLTASPDAPPTGDGVVGVYEVGLNPPVEDPSLRGTATAVLLVVVVEDGTAVGPSAASDSNPVPPGGVTFDPTVNDSPGDAPLDPDSLTILEPPTTGTLTVSGPGKLTYLTGTLDSATAVYQICDADGRCAEGTLIFWRQG